MNLIRVIFIIVSVAALLVLNAVAQPTSAPPVSHQAVTALPDGTLHSPTNFFEVNIGGAISNYVDEVFADYSPTNFALLTEFLVRTNAVNLRTNFAAHVQGVSGPYTYTFAGYILPTNHYFAGRSGESNWWALGMNDARRPEFLFARLDPPAPTASNPNVLPYIFREPLAYLSETQRQNERANETVLILDELEGDGWIITGTLEDGKITLEETQAEYIASPQLMDGIAELRVGIESGVGNDILAIDIYTSGWLMWQSNFVQRTVKGGANVISVPYSSWPVAPNVVLRYGGKNIGHPGDTTDSITITSLAYRAWTKADYVGQVNDSAGLIALADDPIGTNPRTVVNVGTLQRQVDRLNIALLNVSPSVVGIDLEEKPLDWGTYWRTRQDGTGLYTSYLGQDVFWLANGGTAYPNHKAIGTDGTNVYIRTVATTAEEPMVQSSTNLVDWVNYTNAWTSTWPTIQNGTVLITIPIPAGPIHFFRAATTSEVAAASAAHLDVPIEMHGHEVRDGVFIGEGRFSSLTVPQIVFAETNTPATALRLLPGPAHSGSNILSRNIEFVSREGSTYHTNSVFTKYDGGTRSLLLFRDGTSTDQTIYHTGNFNAGAYLTISGFNSWSTNAVKIIYSAPASPTASGSIGQLRTDATNLYVFIPNGGGTGTNWMRIPGSFTW